MTPEHKSNIQMFIKECANKNTPRAKELLDVILESKVKDRVDKTIKLNPSEKH